MRTFKHFIKILLTKKLKLSAIVIYYSILFYFHNVYSYLVLFTIVLCLSPTIFIDTHLHGSLGIFILDNYKANFLLGNKVNKVHPFLFYISFIVFLIKPSSLTPQKFQITYLQILFSLWCTYAFFTLALSLYLGSWWALQEGSWGGWWNWDASEVFGVFLFYILMRGCHLSLYTFSFFNLTYFFMFCLIYVSLYYFSMQLNFMLVSHNFGFRKKYFFFEKFYLGSFVLFLLLYAALGTYARFTDTKKFSKLFYSISPLIFVYLFSTVISFIIAPLTLMKYDFFLRDLPSITIYLISIIALILLIFIILSKFNTFILLTFMYYVPNLFWNHVLAMKVKVRPNNIFLHLIVFCVFLVLFFIINKLSTWMPLGLTQNAQFTLSKLTLNALFLNESFLTELFTKTHPHKTFEQFFVDKVLLQTYLLSKDSTLPPLNTVDYPLPYFSCGVFCLIILVMYFKCLFIYL